MAENILSQDEVNALLRGIVEGDIETQKPDVPEEPGKKTREYNLASQERVIRGRMPTLEIVNERFARFFQVTLSSTLRKAVEFSPVSTEMIKFGEFIKKVALPSNINILRLEPMKRNFLLIIDARMVYLLVDHLFGGVGRGHVKVEGRDFSPIENRITRNILNQAIGDFEKAWAPVHHIGITYIRSEINPQFSAIVSPTEMVISLTYRLDIDGQGRPVYICIPYSTIEPIKEKLYTGFQSDQFEVDHRWILRLRQRLDSVPVRVVAELGTAQARLSDVLTWKPGDILHLDQYVDDPISLSVEKAVRFKGRPGVYRSSRAVRIDDRVFPDLTDIRKNQDEES
ncbi:MAG: flagellar motor switch protein FliM [Nitrospirota bacterium]|nr:flagellar motor switch protein FliM [Nitrospirota bacterium]